MLDFEKEGQCFENQCTACGACVEVCPIIPWTDIRNEDPGEIMHSVLNLYRNGTVDDRARTRIYSCMGCLACCGHCPEDLNPSLGFSAAMALLRNQGVPVPRALSFLLPETDFNLMKAVEAFQITPAQRPWFTDVEGEKPDPAETVLFTGCTGIMQPDVVATALEIIRRVDPTAKALGGVDYCCGDTTLRAGDAKGARTQVRRLIKALNAFSPQKVVFLCPTCKMYVDRFFSDTDWSYQFMTRFLEEHLDDLGPFSALQTTVTIHDACHLVRGKDPESESPRRMLRAIPGIQIIEMEDNREFNLCCGATAMAAIGKPGAELRSFRLKQARKTGAQIMAVYCPACQSIFAPESPHLFFRVQSIISLLGRSMGIVHEDKLYRYLSYQDPDRVLQDADACICSSELPEEQLRAFCYRFFR